MIVKSNGRLPSDFKLPSFRLLKMDTENSPNPFNLMIKSPEGSAAAWFIKE
jgi:hypothetical protein